MTPNKPALPGYTLVGGRADADRIARLSHVMAERTGAFLSRVGVGEGWRCVDVGCGDGQVTIELARAVGPAGRVVGVDNDAEALAIARQAAADAGVEAEFINANATEPFDSDAFDLAYARLLLSHLPDGSAALRAMVAAVRPGGFVAVEDLYTGSLRSEPPAPVLDRLQEVYSATIRAHGGDPTIGPRLRALLALAGLEDVREDAVENPMRSVDDKLFLAELVDNMRTAMLESEAATASELDELKSEIERAARDPERVFYQTRIHQVWGRRPS